MKRFSQADIEGLSAASVELAEAAATIKLTKGAHVPAVIQLLINANDRIVGIRDRALGTITRILAAHDDQLDDQAREKASAEIAAPAGWPSSGEKPRE